MWRHPTWSRPSLEGARDFECLRLALMQTDLRCTRPGPQVLLRRVQVAVVFGEEPARRARAEWLPYFVWSHSCRRVRPAAELAADVGVAARSWLNRRRAVGLKICVRADPGNKTLARPMTAGYRRASRGQRAAPAVVLPFRVDCRRAYWAARLPTTLEGQAIATSGVSATESSSCQGDSAVIAASFFHLLSDLLLHLNNVPIQPHWACRVDHTAHVSSWRSCLPAKENYRNAVVAHEVFAKDCRVSLFDLPEERNHGDGAHRPTSARTLVSTASVLLYTVTT
jgi:hypothetical protein